MIANAYQIAAVTLIAFVVAAAVARMVGALIRRGLTTLDITHPDDRAAVHGRGNQLIRTFTLLSYGAAALASVSFALSRIGAANDLLDARLLVTWLLTHGVHLVIIVIVSTLTVRVASIAIEQLQRNLRRGQAAPDEEWQRRASTVSSILTRLVTVAVTFLAVLMVLRELSVDVMPILTGAGIAGLAVGFGAQNLVRDVISGFFIILEDQVRIGDIARINNVTGSVEHINLRTIVLRDSEGAVQVFPNGSITALANLSKQYSYAVVDIRVAYGENMDRVFGSLREVGAVMEHDPAWRHLVLAPLELQGIESLADGLATIRIKFKTLPLNQGKVANELRKRVMTMFVGRSIRPFTA